MIDGESTSSGHASSLSFSLLPLFLRWAFTPFSPLFFLSFIILLSSFFFHFITFLSSPLYLLFFPQCLCRQCACMYTG